MSAGQVLMDEAGMRRSLTRIAHEILERNQGVETLVLAGIVSKGDLLARRLALQLQRFEGVAVPVGRLDTSNYRDDRPRQVSSGGSSEMPALKGRSVVLVDDVIHHGRTARAAMDALIEFGRPRSIQLAVLIDRGHRELPIRPDYVGKNTPTAERERVEVLLQEVDGTDGVVIVDN
ncbi:MAG: bifunctional pyr operon transcriptional regulator/uracil phosphoribosyltransferase PyrR [Candidatus Dormibacteraceae bacterium]